MSWQRQHSVQQYKSSEVASEVASAPMTKACHHRSTSSDTKLQHVHDRHSKSSKSKSFKSGVQPNWRITPFSSRGYSAVSVIWHGASRQYINESTLGPLDLEMNLSVDEFIQQRILINAQIPVLDEASPSHA